MINILLSIKIKSMWGLGIGDWGLQSPIPNPQSPNNLKIKFIKLIKISNCKFKIVSKLVMITSKVKAI